jgi:hypothetical protein
VVCVYVCVRVNMWVGAFLGATALLSHLSTFAYNDLSYLLKEAYFIHGCNAAQRTGTLLH